MIPRRSRRARAALLSATLLAMAACGGEDPPPRLGVTLGVSSSAFQNGETIPGRHTCDGENVSPPLLWTNGPEQTGSYAIVLSDPDSQMGTFIHWVVWDIPVGTTVLEEGVQTGFGTVGENSAGELGYSGPCPPEGDEPHRYRYTVYALSRLIGLPEGSTWDQLVDKVDDFGLAEGTLEVTYGR